MINKSALKLKYYLELSKLKIMIPVSLTGFTGYFIFDPHLSFKSISISIGILLMAVSASVLNQIQEVALDGKMNRTLYRPLPAGMIKLNDAVLFFFINLKSESFKNFLACRYRCCALADEIICSFGI